MGRFGVWELVIIFILVLVIFGGNRLPELGRGLGRAIGGFRQAAKPSAEKRDDHHQDDSKPDGSNFDDSK